jgi:hypothetical protein
MVRFDSPTKRPPRSGLGPRLIPKVIGVWRDRAFVDASDYRPVRSALAHVLIVVELVAACPAARPLPLEGHCLLNGSLAVLLCDQHAVRDRAIGWRSIDRQVGWLDRRDRLLPASGERQSSDLSMPLTDAHRCIAALRSPPARLCL